MSILFREIYNKAIGLFDDPKVTTAYEIDKIQYEKIMYSYLQNAIDNFHNPSSIAIRLSDYNSPQGTMEIFEGDGETNVFELSEDFVIIPNSLYNYIEGDKKVKAKIEKVSKEVGTDENNNPIIKEFYQVTFPDILPEGQQYSIEQYYCGEFNTDFKNLNRNAPKQVKMIEEQVKGILARLLIKAWAEDQRNDYLEVHDILYDSDFKLHPASSMLRENNGWVRQLDMEVNEKQNKLAWIIRFGQSNSYIGRG